ncbi:MAG: SpaA isopeptide-forming pilin-related protein [Oscillospiraceae bacterium]|nr:SpaA isopeptide-forming pilin-related protein [Oscillospiraceae bacterium]
MKYFGEDVDFSVYVKNVGAVHFTPEDWGYENELACYLRFTLCDSNRKGRYYIKPENMERMFKENNSLVITITNAVLREWDDATDTNGGTVQIHTSNSQFEDEKTGNTLTISYDSGAEESKYLIAVNDGAPAAYKSVAEGLQAVGYAVTDEALYECLFRMNEPGEIFSINGGETKYRMVYATVKDSFQIIGVDEEHQYNGDPLDITSPAKFYSEISKKVPDRLPNHIETPDGTTTAWDVTREAVLTKSVTKADGSAMAENFAVKHGDVLDYRIHFTHYGSGCYENLPLVDELRGSQYLLVPIKENPGLVDKDLETHGDCYILTEGEYKNVAVGVDDEEKLLTAHSISVKKLEGTEGLHTTIKWYFDSLPSGNYAMYVDYQTLVSLDLTGVNYSVHSEVWMNDREGSRLYDSFGGGGTLLEYQKEIVEQRGSKPEKDELFEDGYSLVGPGEQVTYRLELENPNDFEITLNGANMADMLPDTFGQFAWEKDVNITGFDIKTEGNVTLEKMDSWELGTKYGNLLDQRQYILWPDAASVTLPKDSEVYIYITLTYPDGEIWDNYAEALKGDPIDNRMYVFRHASTVKHDLKEEGRAMLQKGVYGSYLYRYGHLYDFHENGSREYFNNWDSGYRAVLYYVTVVNDGNKRLYLSDIYDALPKGFSYMILTNGTFWNGAPLSCGQVFGNENTTLVTKGGESNMLADIGGDVTYRSATVTATAMETGVKFSFSAGDKSNSVHWDEARNQCYLKRNEAIVFGYICSTNIALEDNTATNTAAMAYVDPSGTGMKLVTAEDRSAAAPQTESFFSNNDGNRYIMTSWEAENCFGVDTGETWLASDVTLYRGGIVPGIQKQTVKYKDFLTGEEFDYQNYVRHADEITWKITLYNGGTQSMTDYTIVETLPAPYTLTGKVFCVVRNAVGKWETRYDLLEVPKHIPQNGEVLAVRDIYLGMDWYAKIGSNQPTAFGIEEKTRGYVSLSLDEQGNEVVTLDLEGRYFSVPEGGSVEFYLSAVNPTTSYKNSVFTNQAVVVPTQEYTLNSEGTEITLPDGSKGIRATAPVTVSSGFVTSSLNEVEFGGDEGSSDPTKKKYVVLDGPESEFQYTLTVNNDTNRPMSKLVLIDNLPDAENDHTPFDTNAPRDSEFAVHLAETPGFVVTVVPKEGESYTPEKYTIQYSKSTDFGGPQSSQWMGEEGSQWTTDPTDARAIRVIISETIPVDAKVTVTFKVKADKDAKPGQTAWNNFGYHYSLEGNSNELEAMPVAVGAKIPSVPKLMKKLVDSKGNPLNAAQNTEFTFLVTSTGGVAGTFKAEVPADSSESDWVEISPEGWTWEKGKTYTVTETNIPEPYAFGKFLNGKGNSYTFTYDPSANQRIVCQNVMDHWSIRVTKVDGRDADTVLEGAEFKLYGLETNTAETKEYEGQTWYLCCTGTTDENGVLEWKELDQNKYLLVETKAPDGYQLPAEPYRVLTRSDTGELEEKVENVSTYELPETGGMGTMLYSISGGVLSTAAGYALGKKKRRQSNQK